MKKNDLLANSRGMTQCAGQKEFWQFLGIYSLNEYLKINIC